MKKASIFSIMVLFLSTSAVVAQGVWNWPEDPDKRKEAEEKNALYTDMYKADNFEAAKKPLEWLLKETPDLNPSIYINGAKIYGALADAAKGTSKNNLQDSTVLLYDLRIQYFGDEANVTNRKAYEAYMQWRERRDKFEALFGVMQKALELNGSEILDNNLAAFMMSLRLHKLTGGDVSDEQVLEYYEQISNILDAKEVASNNNSKYARYRDTIEKILESTVDINCSFIKNNYMDKLKEDPENIDLANKVVKYSFAAKCTDEDFFIDAANVVIKVQPDYGLIKYLASKYKDRENYNRAESLLTKSLEYTEDNLKKGEVFLELADIASKKNNKALARDYLLKSINADPSKSEIVYKQIGYLYYGSYEECKGGQNMVEDRAIFIAAYEMFAKAGDQRMMENCKSQFPSKEEIFLQGNKAGETLRVNCWIKESVSLRTRD